jgi:hypothetical protein
MIIPVANIFSAWLPDSKYKRCPVAISCFSSGKITDLLQMHICLKASGIDKASLQLNCLERVTYVCNKRRLSKYGEVRVE